MKNFFNTLSLITLILTAGVVFHILYLAYYPFEIVKLNSFHVVSKTVKRGEPLFYILDFEKKKNFKATVKYFLVDGIVIRLEDSGTHRSIGKYIVPNGKIIPTTILPGWYKLRIELEYNVLPWRSILYVWESEKFQIL